MARMVCRCGATLSNSACPNNVSLKVYTDEEWDKIMDCETISPLNIPLPKYDVWKCPDCQRIYVFDDQNDEAIMVYNLEK